MGNLDKQFNLIIPVRSPRTVARGTAAASKSTNGIAYLPTIQATTAQAYSWTGFSSLRAASVGVTLRARF